MTSVAALTACQNGKNAQSANVYVRLNFMSLTRCRGSRRLVAWTERYVPRLVRVSRGSRRPATTAHRSDGDRQVSWSRRQRCHDGQGTGEHATSTPPSAARTGSRSSSVDDERTTSIRASQAEQTHRHGRQRCDGEIQWLTRITLFHSLRHEVNAPAYHYSTTAAAAAAAAARLYVSTGINTSSLHHLYTITALYIHRHVNSTIISFLPMHL